MLSIGCAIALFAACNPVKNEESNSEESSSLFTKVSSAHTQVKFKNTLTETDTFNYFSYSYIYMGGGVSVADFNNDGLTDIYFVGNMVDNRLYLNKGDLVFEDVTEASGAAGDARWMLGSTVCDINNDGLLDIYISVSGKDEICKNLLYVNKGIGDNAVPRFEEEADKYGIADTGHSTQSVFFDYDNDGDLDLYVANYPITNFKAPSFYYKQMLINAKMKSSDHLYKNNGDGTFTDVTEASGILNFGLSLGITITDLNEDGFKDIYVSNDFASPDMLYMNNGDGTFTDRIKELTKQTSYYGMGLDIADFNNDGLMDIIQVDMAPEDNRRSKENMAGMDPAAFYELVDLGLHHQYMYNSFQLNRGLDENGMPQYSNIAKLAGVSSTDWSWASLFADFDNDGWKDIFITNGTRRDINNNDFFKKLESKDVYFSSTSNNKIEDQLENVKKMPSEPIANYIYKNNGDLTFTKEIETWGLDDESFSNGAVYVDLDNDGDLELVVNNIDNESVIYKNTAVEKNNSNFLKIEFEGSKLNKLGLGARAEVWSENMRQVAELTLTRGYESSVEPILYFGLGKNKVDSLLITWPDKKSQLIRNVEVNQKLVVSYEDADQSEHGRPDHKIEPIFEDITDRFSKLPVHKENEFDDFGLQVLLPHKMSNFGPALAVGDINGDTLDDFFVGGASGFNGALYLQNAQGEFDKVDFQPSEDAIYEDLGATFFDADGDNDLDLYIVSGGNEFEEGHTNYQDRLFINTNGSFTKAEKGLPTISASGSCVKPFDYDNDGDLDLFVGGRLRPGKYPYAGTTYLLENNAKNGQPNFEIVTDKVAPGLSDIGMVTDALWADFNGDNVTDLLVVGEWMPITVLINENGIFQNRSSDYFNENTTGWWFSIDQGDFDNDGDSDFVIGNLGLNYKYQAQKDKPFNVYANDFDNNNQSDIVLSYHNSGKEYPVRGRGCSSAQIPAIKTKYKDYKSFSQASVIDIYGDDNLENSLSYSVESFASVVLKNNGKSYQIVNLPNEAQLSPINDMIVQDFDKDGNLDLLVSGNLYSSEVETPRGDAGIGLYLKGDGMGNFQPLTFNESGVYIPYDSKHLSTIEINDRSAFVSVSNQGPVQIFSKKP
ncbi:hypothetical protein E1140_07115 [Fulvivirga lutimaris]|nr:hypothetical protein [Fulvivirga lutimaris]